MNDTLYEGTPFDLSDLPPPPTPPTSKRRFSRRYVCESCGFKGRGSPMVDQEWTDCPVCSDPDLNLEEEAVLETCRHRPQAEVLEQERKRQEMEYARKCEQLRAEEGSL